MEAWRIVVFGLSLIAIGFAAGRFSSGSRSEAVSPPPPTASPWRPSPPMPARAPVAPAPPPPAAAAHGNVEGRQDRVREIDRELGEIPSDDAARLKGLAERMQTERQRIADLRDSLAASQRDLLNESFRSSMSAQNVRASLAFQERAAALQQQLMDAKIAVSEQERILHYMAGSSEAAPEMIQLRAEMARRKARAAALEQSLADLVRSERSLVEGADAAEQARLRAWRDRQARLEADYASSLSRLALDGQAYGQLSNDAAEHRRHAEALRAERKALIAEESRAP